MVKTVGHVLVLPMLCGICSLLKAFILVEKIKQAIIPIEFPEAHKHWPLVGGLVVSSLGVPRGIEHGIEVMPPSRWLWHHVPSLPYSLVLALSATRLGIVMVESTLAQIPFLRNLLEIGHPDSSNSQTQG